MQSSWLIVTNHAVCPKKLQINSVLLESAPIHVVINAVHKYFEFYTLITMTSLQPTQAQGLGCTRGI